MKITSSFNVRSLILLILIFLSSISFGQDVQSYYIGLGANASYAPLQGLNNVFRHYQNVRNESAANSPEGETWINNLSDINVFIGPSISFGYMFKPAFNLEFRYMDRKNSRVSQVLNTNGSLIKRGFDVKSRTFGFGASRLFTTGKNEYIIGGTMNLTQFVIDGTNLRVPQPINQSNIGGMIFVKYIFTFSESSPFAVVINPYYQYHFTPVDFFQLNRVINPKTFRNLSSEDVRGARSYFGLEIQLNYFVFTGFKKETIQD